MRSSKSRSRSKNNRNRSSSSVGNVVNRVFDSSGPEGKVRGTPQQIIDKYNQLARDAQLSNDRVAAENFQQHAEHYLRMLGEAQREQDQRREQQEQENRERQAQRDRSEAQNNNGGQNNAQGGGGNNNGGQNNGNQNQPAQGNGQGGNEQRASRRDQNEPPRYVAQDVLDLSEGSDDDSGLVDTPENSARSASAGPAQDAPVEQTGGEQEPAPKPKPKRKPRKKPEPKSSDNAPDRDASSEGNRPENGTADAAE